MLAPEDEGAHLHTAQVRQLEALDPVLQHRPKRVQRPSHLERPLPLVEEVVRERWMVRARRVAEGAADDPVGAGRNSVGAREPGPDEQVADPGPGASGRERVAVEQDDPARFELMPQRDADGNRGAERVADDNRPPEPEVPGERADEAHPLAQRVRAVSLAVAEGREVDREDAVRATEARARLLPNEARHDEAAEQDDRAAAISPVPIGDELAVQANERPRIERGRRLHSSRGGGVVGHRRERHHDEQLQQDDA